MAIHSNKYRIGLGLVVIGTAALGVAMATFYRPVPVADRLLAPLPPAPRVVQKPPVKPVRAEVKCAQVDLADLLHNLLPSKSVSSRGKAAEAAPPPPSLAYTPNLLVYPTDFMDPQLARRARAFSTPVFGIIIFPGTSPAR